MCDFFTYNNMTMINVDFKPSIALFADFENWTEFETQQVKELKNYALTYGLDTTLVVCVNSDYNSGLWNQENIKKLAELNEVDRVIFYVIHPMFKILKLEEIYHNLHNFLNLQKIQIANNFTNRVESKLDVSFFKEFWKENCLIKNDYKNKPDYKNLIDLLAESNFSEFKNLTKLDYCFSGRVSVGKQRGREFGYPTINLLTPELLLISDGVYACEVKIVNWEKTLIGAGFYWTNELSQKVFEVYILDFSQDIYDQKVDIKLVKKIREPVKFSSVDELKKYLAEDVKKVRKVF